MITRRKLLKAGGFWLTSLILGFGGLAWGSREEEPIEIRMISNPSGTYVTFDPIGLRIRPGRRIRWTNASDNVHTSTAYHPANDRHPLRIPSAAKPWDSSYLMHRGDSFSLTLTVEGVYDYFCTPHEADGMVGRIIVTDPGKVNPTVFKSYPDDPGRSEWRKIPEAALRNFPPVEMILRMGRVPAPAKHMGSG